MTTKEQIHRLIDKLPEADAPTVLRILDGLRAMHDPVMRTLDNAPIDDEPDEPDEPDDDDTDGGLTEAREQAGRGEFVSAVEMRREFGW